MIKKYTALSLLTLMMIFSSTATAVAAKPAHAGGGGGGGAKEPLGMDISYPQCGRKVPSDQAFGIVGVNGGNAANTNPCLADQLVWASKSSGAVPAQEKTQLYVNTANPGEVIDQMTSAWPSSHLGAVDNPYGNDCDGTNNQACSWEYGWGRGEFAVNYFVTKAREAKLQNTSPSFYKWWLDVETMNTWQSDNPTGHANNVAALEGWVAYFKHIGARVGLYSTAYQWGVITGNAASDTSNLNGLENWRPGGANLSTAKQACTAAPLTTGGKVVLTQFVSKNLDYDYSCV